MKVKESSILIMFTSGQIKCLITLSAWLHFKNSLDKFEQVLKNLRIVQWLTMIFVIFITGLDFWQNWKHLFIFTSYSLQLL